MLEFYVQKEDGEFEKASQEQLDKKIADRLRRKDEKHAEELKQYEGFKKQAEEMTASVEDFKNQIATLKNEKEKLEQDFKKSENEVIRQKVMKDYKLSDELEDFITGDSEDELRSKAERLAHSVGNSSIKIEKIERPEAEISQSQQIARNLLGKNND